MASIDTMESLDAREFWTRCAEGWFELFLVAQEQGDVAKEEYWEELVWDAEFMRLVLDDGTYYNEQFWCSRV